MTESGLPAALKTFDLTKRFAGPGGSQNGFLGVNHLNITVNSGDIYGFLGPNGSGKTTTFRLVLGLVRRTSGTAEIFGLDVVRRRLEALAVCGALVDVPAFYPYLTAYRNLELFGRLGGGVEDSRIRKVLDNVGIASRAASRVSTFSHGMRQRLGLALAMLRRPRLLLLDEPTNGLDPEGTYELLSAIRALSETEGVTIVFSSHLLSEVEELCNRTAILRNGELLYEGGVQELVAGDGTIEVSVSDSQKACDLLTSKGLSALAEEDGVLLVTNGDPSGINELLVGAGFRVSRLAPRKRTLREVFLGYMKQNSASKTER
ncbi:MAG: ABC transporter ATP-binding protein [Candidatus Brocadiia bacterium]